MLIFLYRPSPQIPKPSLAAAILCYDCAIQNIKIQKKMFDQRTVDMTWVLVHQVYMTCIIMMWCLSYEEIRKIHPRDNVAEHIQTGLECLDLMIERWPGVSSAREIFWRLSMVALQCYEPTSQIATDKVTAASAPASVIAPSGAPQKNAIPTQISRHSASVSPPPNYSSSPPHTPPSRSPGSFHTTPASSRIGSVPTTASMIPSLDAQVNGSFSNSAPIFQYLNQSFDSTNNPYGIISQSPPPRMHSQSPSAASSNYYGSSSPSSDFHNPPTPNAFVNDDNTPRQSISGGYAFEPGYSLSQQAAPIIGPTLSLTDDIGISPQTMLPNSGMPTYPVGMGEIPFQAASIPASLPPIAEDSIAQYTAAPFAGADQLYAFYPPTDVSQLLTWTSTGHVDALQGNPYASNTYRMDVIDPQRINDLMMTLENESQGDIFSGMPSSTASYL